MKPILKTSAYFFAFFGVLFIPASSFIFSFQDQFAPHLFSWLAACFGADVLGFSSDSAALYLLLVFLIFMSILLAFLMTRFKFWQVHQEKVLMVIGWILVYYLASRLMVYGYDKIVKTQFYLPEPNILFTPFGGLSKDILFWSVMGTSKMYCLITGLFEIIPALLLLFKKTRTTGLLLTFFVLTNVLAINFGFDISVKLYSLFLLFITLLLLTPNFVPLFNFFKGETAQLKGASQAYPLFSKPFVYSSLKVFVICLMLIETLYFSFSTGHFNDDLAERPPLHGAYEVNVEDVQGAQVLFNAEVSIKRLFFHRRGFLIFQINDFEMVDFKVEVDTRKKQLIVWNYANEMNILPYDLYEGDETILEVFTYTSTGSEILWFNATALDWKLLPAVQDDFHWTIDSYQ